MGVADVRAAARSADWAMTLRSHTSRGAWGLFAALVAWLAPLTPAPTAAHDTSYSHADLDWQAGRIELRVTQPRAALRTVAAGSWAIIAAGSYWFIHRLLLHSWGAFGRPAPAPAPSRRV